MHHRFTLEPYHGRDSRTTCPGCGHHRHTFKRYIDTETNQPLADHVGKCDRIDACGYHYPPREYFNKNPDVSLSLSKTHTRQAKPFDTLPKQYVADTTRAYRHNNFVLFLVKLFGEDTALRLAARYHIGTSKHWQGATIFWQIDVTDSVRTGKIMLYNRTDGHRVKQPFNHISWVHSLSRESKVLSRESKVKSQKSQVVNQMQNPDLRLSTQDFRLKNQDFRLHQCFFGEHLLTTAPYKTVAVAESEKTAVICSFIYPKYIWLAAGSLEGLSRDKCRVLKHRRVILFPDVNGYDKWKQKAREMNLRLPTAKFTVDDTLERVATDDQRLQGIDLADLWLEQLTNKL